MMVFSGNRNTFDFRDVILEIDISLYARVPQGGYTRCFIVSGNGNTFNGLGIRSTGPNQGYNGNLLSVGGADNTVENFTLHVYG